MALLVRLSPIPIPEGAFRPASGSGRHSHYTGRRRHGHHDRPPRRIRRRGSTMVDIPL